MGGKVIFAHGEQNARGVVVLFKKRMNAQIVKMTIDLKGRYIIVDLQLNDIMLMLINIYAPNNYTPDFFLEDSCKLTEQVCSDIVMGGNFNMVSDVLMDSKGRVQNNEKSHIVLTLSPLRLFHFFALIDNRLGVPMLN